MKWIVVLLTLFCPCQGNGCPKGWIRFGNSDRCFYISKNMATFDLAKKDCQSRHSHLAPVLTCDTQADLSLALAVQRWNCGGKKPCMEFWIDVYTENEVNNNTWKSASVDIGKHFWARGFPYGIGRCAYMSFYDYIKRGTWRNDNCDRKLRYVCIACPDLFDYFPETNECVRLILDKRNWNDARLACTKLKRGAQLATIKDEKKMAAVQIYLASRYRPFGKPLFTGCVLPNKGDPLLNNKVWLAGQPQDPRQCNATFAWKPIGLDETNFTYTNWIPGSPNCNPKTDFCVGVVDSSISTLKWDTIPCVLAMCSLCEFP